MRRGRAIACVIFLIPMQNLDALRMWLPKLALAALLTWIAYRIYRALKPGAHRQFLLRFARPGTAVPLAGSTLHAKRRITCPQCQGEAFKVTRRIERIEDFYGAVCANCARTITKEDIKRWSAQTAKQMLADASK